jgi:3-hydroxyacyl-[acyl-carrier-protein] dehydratase
MEKQINPRDVLQHRFPFLLIDKVVEVEKGKRAVAIKNVSNNEPFFQGHFPDFPVMPGVLQVEALAQAACIAFLQDEDKDKLGMFTGITNMKFKRQVFPGDVLKLEAEITAFKMGMGKAKVKASTDDDVTAIGEIKFAIVDTKK